MSIALTRKGTKTTQTQSRKAFVADTERFCDKTLQTVRKADGVVFGEAGYYVKPTGEVGLHVSPTEERAWSNIDELFEEVEYLLEQLNEAGIKLSLQVDRRKSDGKLVIRQYHKFAKAEVSAETEE